MLQLLELRSMECALRLPAIKTKSSRGEHKRKLIYKISYTKHPTGS